MTRVALCVAAVLLMAACPQKPEESGQDGALPKRIGKAGDPCEKDGDAACQDDNTIISCHGGTWSTTPCRGPEGCTRMGIMVKCDESIGLDGEKCSRAGGYACNGDNSAQLKCVSGKWKTVKVCRGPKRCESKYPFVNCDTTVGRRGDPCVKEGVATCDADGITILVCLEGSFTKKRSCAKKCVNENKRVSCR